MERIQANRDNATCSTVDNNDSEPVTEVIFNFKGSDKQTECNPKTENIPCQLSNPIQTTDQAAAVPNQSEIVPPNPRVSRNIPQTTSVSLYDHSVQSRQSIDVQSINRLICSNVPQAATYAETNIRNTMAGLACTEALARMKEQQVGLQQQQISMEVKQDSISGTLMNVMSLLQELTKRSLNLSHNNCVSSIENRDRSQHQGIMYKSKVCNL